jgi:hypothetical protein
MVIKIQTADSSHGHNAINYAMNKKADDGRKPEFISSANMPWDNIFGDPIEPRAVWDYMKMRQKNCGRKIEDPFFHIELCPSKEESAGFTKSDWIKLIDDSIRNLSTPFVSKRRGKIKGWDIKNSQWVACLHTDTDKPHIHLILNRITEDNKVLDDTQYKDRAKQAANRLAVERGWTKAESVGERDGAGAAILSIICSFVGKLSALISTIPGPVIGGISFLLYGMIGTSGLRILVDSKVDYSKNRNQMLTSVIFVTGLSGAALRIGNIELTGMVLACVVGMAMSLVFYVLDRLKLTNDQAE